MAGVVASGFSRDDESRAGRPERVEWEVARIARGQQSLITRQQAIDLGMSTSSIQRRRRSGRWVDAAPGVYLVNGAPFTWRTKVMSVCLATDGIASHRTGSVLLRVKGFAEGRIEISVPRGHASRVVDCIQHERRDFDRIQPVRIDGIPTTPANRLIADLGAVIPYERYEQAVANMVGRGLLTWDDAIRSYFRHCRRGRDGNGALRAVLDHRYGQLIPESELERFFLYLLEEAGLVHQLEQQLVIHDERGFVARVDFGNERKKVAIELDSVDFHLNLEAFHADPRKRNRLEGDGWTVLVFTWADLRDEPEVVIAQLRAALGL